MNKNKPRGKSKDGKSKLYFTDEHEQKVLEYIAEKDSLKKDKLYTEFLRPVFVEMIEKIVFSYRFDKILTNIEEHIADCLSYLVIIAHNYNSDKKSKAFSYFSVIVRNYFFNVVKKQVTKTKEKITEYGDCSYLDTAIIDPMGDLEEEMEKFQFKKSLIKNIDMWISNRYSTEDDIKVLQAIKILILTVEDYDCFTKKAFFIFLKDLSGLNSKQVSSSIKRIKIRYNIFVDNWNYGIK